MHHRTNTKDIATLYSLTLILKPVGFRHVVSDRETLRVGFVSMTLPSIYVGKCERMGGKRTYMRAFPFSDF